MSTCSWTQLDICGQHPNGRYNISMCKMFGNHWNQGKRQFTREDENNLVQNYLVDTLHPKRRTASSKVWEVESEQEEHSFSLSQHSSPSQSDQEQTPLKKSADSILGSDILHSMQTQIFYDLSMQTHYSFTTSLPLSTQIFYISS